MSNLVIINGSPKTKRSVSKSLIEVLLALLSTEAEIYQSCCFITQEITEEQLSTIINAQVLVLAFPLYIDSLPAPLINLLNLIEEQVKKSSPSRLPLVYAICNCGFYEPHQTKLALMMIQNFCLVTKMTWAFGLGIGCGPNALDLAKRKNGSNTPIYNALRDFADAIDKRLIAKDVFVKPTIPRFLYKLSGNLSWKVAAKKYGTERKLKARPHAE